jgi:hypothetical protein
MKNYIILFSGLALLASCGGGAPTAPAADVLEAKVNAKVQQTVDQLKTDCDARVIQTAQMRADSLIAVRGAAAAAKAAVKPVEAKSTTVIVKDPKATVKAPVKAPVKPTVKAPAKPLTPAEMKKNKMEGKVVDKVKAATEDKKNKMQGKQTTEQVKTLEAKKDKMEGKVSEEIKEATDKKKAKMQGK